MKSTIAALLVKTIILIGMNNTYAAMPDVDIDVGGCIEIKICLDTD